MVRSITNWSFVRRDIVKHLVITAGQNNNDVTIQMNIQSAVNTSSGVKPPHTQTDTHDLRREASPRDTFIFYTGKANVGPSDAMYTTISSAASPNCM